ncbi:peptidoglycan binding protein CsiV [Shewanella sp.]|uniref:peptidoglycan binding protein CsiV n=1 Tax=Shewanella sp. TaxID=50422 RepID=UPI003F2A25AE
MLRQLTVAIATLIALSHSPQSRADAWYEIEVYVFERQNQSTEQWLKTPTTIQTERAIDLTSAVVGQAIPSVTEPTAPCTLVYDADANSRCAELGAATGANNSAATLGNSTAFSYRYPAQIGYQIGSNSPVSSADGVLLPSSRGQFASIISSLSRERGNRSLLHMTWQQSIRSKNAAKPIRLFAGKDFAGSYHFDGRKITSPATHPPQTLTAESGANTVQLTATPSPVWELDGTLNIYLNHYLYIETALTLRQEGRKLMAQYEDEAGAVTAPKVMTPYLMAIALEQNRRLKSDEIHYLDHPQMGMVIQIRKMSQPSS